MTVEVIEEPKLGDQPEQDKEAAADRDHPARADPGHRDEADVLGVGGVGEGIHEAGQQRRQAVGGQALGQVPITVITVPVTSGGKNRKIIENGLAIASPKMPDTSSAP